MSPFIQPIFQPFIGVSSIQPIPGVKYQYPSQPYNDQLVFQNSPLSFVQQVSPVVQFPQNLPFIQPIPQDLQNQSTISQNNQISDKNENENNSNQNTQTQPIQSQIVYMMPSPFPNQSLNQFPQQGFQYTYIIPYPGAAPQLALVPIQPNIVQPSQQQVTKLQEKQQNESEISEPSEMPQTQTNDEIQSHDSKGDVQENSETKSDKEINNEKEAEQ